MGVVLLAGTRKVDDPRISSTVDLVYEWAFKGAGELVPIAPFKSKPEILRLPWLVGGESIWSVDYWDAALRRTGASRRTGATSWEWSFYNKNLYEDHHYFRFPTDNENSTFDYDRSNGSKLIQDWQRSDFDRANNQAVILDDTNGALNIYEFGMYPHENRKVVSIYHPQLYKAVDVTISNGRVDVLCADESWLLSFNIDGTPLVAPVKHCRSAIYCNPELIDHFQYVIQAAPVLEFDGFINSVSVFADEHIIKSWINLEKHPAMGSSVLLQYPFGTIQTSVLLDVSFGMHSSIDIPSMEVQSSPFLIDFDIWQSHIRTSPDLLDRSDILGARLQFFGDADYLRTSVELDPFFAIFIDTPNVVSGEPDIPRKWLGSISALNNVLLVTEGKLCAWVYDGYGSLEYTASSFMGSIIERDTLDGVLNQELLGYHRLKIDRTQWAGVSDYAKCWLFENPLSPNFGQYADAENSVLHIDKYGWNVNAHTNFNYYDMQLVEIMGEVRIVAAQMGRFRYKGLNVAGQYESVGSWNYPEDRYTLLYWDMNLSFRDDRMMSQFSEYMGTISSGMKIMPRGLDVYYDAQPISADRHTIDLYVAVDAMGASIQNTDNVYLPDGDPNLGYWRAGSSNPLRFPEGVDQASGAGKWVAKPFVLGRVYSVDSVPVIQSEVSLNTEFSGMQSNVGLGHLGTPLPFKARTNLVPDESFLFFQSSLGFFDSDTIHSEVNIYVDNLMASTPVLQDNSFSSFKIAYIITPSGRHWRVDWSVDDVYTINYMGVITGIDWTVGDYPDNTYSVRPLIVGRHIWSISTNKEMVCHDIPTKQEVEKRTIYAPFVRTTTNAQKWEREYSSMVLVGDRIYYFCDTDVSEPDAVTPGIGYVYIGQKTGSFYYSQSDFLGEASNTVMMDMISDGTYIYILVNRSGKTEATKDVRGLWLYKFDQNMIKTSSCKITSVDFGETEYMHQRPIRMISMNIAKGIIMLGNQPVSHRNILAITTEGEVLWHKAYSPVGFHSLEGLGLKDVFLTLGNGQDNWHFDADRRSLYGAGFYDMEWHGTKNVPVALVYPDGTLKEKFYLPQEEIPDAFWNTWDGVKPDIYVPDLVKDPSGTAGEDPHTDLFGLLFDSARYLNPPICGVLQIDNAVRSETVLVHDEVVNPDSVPDITGFTVWGKVQKT